MDLNVAAEAEVETTLGEVIPVMAEDSDEVAEEIEPGPGLWPMCRKKRGSSAISLLFSLNSCTQVLTASRRRSTRWWYMQESTQMDIGRGEGGRCCDE